MIGSSTVSVVEFTVVVVPSICKSLLIITLPVPLGASVMLPLLTETILCPLTSKLPPNCGVVSSTTFANGAVPLLADVIRPLLSTVILA